MHNNAMYGFLRNHYNYPSKIMNARMNCSNNSSYVQIPYLYVERNWADYYGFVSKHIRKDRDDHSRACKPDARTRARTHARNKKSKGSIKRTQDSDNGTGTVLYRSICEIPFDYKTDGSHAQRTRKSMWDLRYCTVRYPNTVRYGTVPYGARPWRLRNT